MNQFSRGQKGKLSDLGLSGPFNATLTLAAPGIGAVDVSCFGLDASGKLSDDRYMIFYNQTASPADALTMRSNGNQTIFSIDLARLPDSIDKLVFTASIDQQGAMRSLGSCQMALGDAVSFPFSGADFQEEKAVIVGELYRRDGQWRFGAVGQGFNGGLSALLKHFGGTEMAASQPTPTPAPISAPVPAPEVKRVSLSKITLEKRGDKISLEKQDNKSFGRIRVNLNWNQQAQAAPAPEASGFIAKLFGQRDKKASSSGIDLDIGCLFELADGRKSAVQALGDAWGNFDRPPYINLDADDRTGAATGGENIFINGAHFDQIKRVLIYTFIYEGVPNWAATDGVVTIEVPNQPPVEVRLDNGANLTMCAIAMIENHGGNLQVTKLVEYFSGRGNATAHEEMDRRYGFGLKWATGTKD
jgi:tellurite resistance protein TerA